MRFSPVFLILLFVSLPGFAAERVQVGDVLPHDLTLSDQFGEEQSFEMLVGNKGVTLVFFRSADWCSYCQIQMTKLNKEAEAFEKEGYPLVGISYDSVETLERFEQKLQMKIETEESGTTFLSDPQSKAISAFGLLNTEYEKGSFAYGIPHPAIYIVNKDRTIKAVLSEEGYKKRPDAEAIFQAIAE